MSVGEMSVGEMSIGEVSVGEMSVGEMSWIPRYHNNPTTMHPTFCQSVIRVGLRIFGRLASTRAELQIQHFKSVDFYCFITIANIYTLLTSSNRF